jgi:hypothetical protein
MKTRVLLAGIGALAGLTLAGCSGSSTAGLGSGTGGGSSPNAVFEGTYIAPYTDSGSNTDSGEFAINISATGAVTGRYIDVTSAITSAITSGQITLTSSTASTDTGTITVTDAAGTATGTFTLASGVLSGSVVDSSNNLTVNYTAGLASTAGGNSFAGWYNGTFTQNGAAGSPANTLTFIIDPLGNITALSVNNISGQSGTSVFTGTIVTGTGAVNFPANGNTQATSGTLLLLGGHLTGSVNNSGQTSLIVVNLTQNS